MPGSTLWGESVDAARRLLIASVGQFTVNVTVTKKTGLGVPPGMGRMRIIGVHVMGDAIPSDPDGTMLLTVRVRDVSEAAFDTVVLSQDLETLITEADRYFACTLAAETAEEERTIDVGDTIDVQLANNSAAIATNPNLFVMIEVVPLPDFQDHRIVGHKAVVGSGA